MPSKVSGHLLLHNDDTDFNDFAILCQDNKGFRLSLEESILISRDSPIGYCTLVRQRPMKSLSSTCPSSVCPFVRQYVFSRLDH